MIGCEILIEDDDEIKIVLKQIWKRRKSNPTSDLTGIINVDTLNTDFTPDEMIQTHNADTHENQSLVWTFAALALWDQPQYLNTVWSPVVDRITLGTLLAAPKTGPYQNQSLLIWLFSLATSGYPHFFKVMLNKFKAQLPPESLIPRILYMTMCVSKKLLNQDFFNQLTDELLSQVTGIFDIPNNSSHEKHTILINARNTLFSALNDLKNTNLNNHHWVDIKEKAENAYKAGYINAYYDLGNALIEKYPYEAYEAYDRVPPESWYFKSIPSHLINTAKKKYFTATQFPPASFERSSFLKKALFFALKIPKEQKFPLIQKIASSYIESDIFKIPASETSGFVPMRILNLFDNNISVDVCFIHFEKIRGKLIKERMLKLLDGSKEPQTITWHKNQPVPKLFISYTEIPSHLLPPKWRYKRERYLHLSSDKQTENAPINIMTL